MLRLATVSQNPSEIQLAGLMRARWPRGIIWHSKKFNIFFNV